MTYLQGLKSIFNLRTFIVVLIFTCIVYYYYSHQDWELEVRISADKRIDLLAIKDEAECIRGFQGVFPGLTFHRDPIENDDDADLYLQSPPDSEFRFSNISIYSDAELRVKYGLLETRGPEIPKSITFEIEISDGERSERLLSDTMEPRDEGKIKQFRYKSCDLDGFEDSICSLRFTCRPSSDCPSDAAICAWGNLKIDSSGRRDALKRIDFARKSVAVDFIDRLEENVAARRFVWARGAGNKNRVAPAPWGVVERFAPYRDAREPDRYEQVALVFGEAARIDVPKVRIPDGDEVELDFSIGLRDLSVAAGGATFVVHVRNREVFRETVTGGGLSDRWRRRRIDVSSLAGQEVSISFSVDYPAMTPVNLSVPARHPLACGEEPGGGEAGGVESRLTVERSLAAFGHPRIVSKERIHRRFSGKKRTPNLILINIDSLPASYLGCYGSPYDLTPCLDRMADVGILFKDACSCSPQALPSMATVLSGLYPSAHGAGMSDRNYLHHSIRTLPDAAQQRNATTAAFVAGSGIGEYACLENGFETYVSLPGQNARKLNALFNDWLISNDAFRFFAYLHYGDPHAPFLAPAGLRDRYVPSALRDRIQEGNVTEDALEGQVPSGMTESERIEFLRGRYFGEIEYVDRRIQEILSLLGDHGLMQKTIIVVTSSYGQAFMEHGVMGQGQDFYNESIRVPLILCGPDQLIGPHRVVEGMVDHGALAATCARLMGFDLSIQEKDVWQPSLFPLEERTSDQDSYAWSELLLPTGPARPEARHLRAVMDWRYKLISDGVLQELYDTVEDPLEKKDLSGSGKSMQDILMKKMDEILSRSADLRPAH